MAERESRYSNLPRGRLASALERRDAQLARMRDLNQSAEVIAQEAVAAMAELRSMMPQNVTPVVRTGLSWGTGLMLGTINGTTELPKVAAPAAVAAIGVASQFADLSADWAEAAAAVTDGAGAVTTYVIAETGAKSAADWLRAAWQ